MSNENNTGLAISLEQFQKDLLQAKENTKDGSMTSTVEGLVDVEYFAFGNTTTGKNRSKISSKTEFEWHHHSEDKEKDFISTTKIVGLRGFVLKSKDGYVLYAGNEEKDTKNGKMPPPVCSTVSCELLGTQYHNKKPSFAPLTRWQDNSSNIKFLEDIKLKGSRGEYCANCIVNKNNESGTVNGRTNKCQPSTGLLFAVVEIGLKTNKNASGIDWKPVTTLKTEDDEFLYDAPVIINIETSKATQGSGNKDNSIFDVTAGKLGLSTVSNGGPKYIPDDVLMFYPYWQSLLSQSCVQEAPKGGGFPEHPQLPYMVTARTEIYLAPPEKTVVYANTVPVYRTNGNAITDQDTLVQLAESISAYAKTYDTYVKNNNINDRSYESAPKVASQLNGTVGNISLIDDNDSFNPAVFKAS